MRDPATEHDLYEAVEHDRLADVTALLRNGLPPAQAVRVAAACAKPDLLRTLLTTYAPPPSVLGEILHFVCSLRGGKAAVVEQLLEAGANPNHIEDGDTPLMWVVEESGDADTVRALLVAGADPNPDEVIESPLFVACKWNHTECAHALIDGGALVNAADADGWTCITMAVRDAGVVDHLLRAGANPARSKKPPLEWARHIEDADPEAISILEHYEKNKKQRGHR